MRQNAMMWQVAAVALLTGVAVSAETADGVPARPDILIVLADDQTWTDNGCYGHPDVKTPQIDRLASEGMRFTHCFTATAMCAPTRQQLYTGLFPVRSGAFPNHSQVYSGTRSIVHHLKALGYRVGLVGKRHFGPAESFPFEKVEKEAIPEFLARDRGQPYCLVYASKSPHLPWTAGDATKYDPAKLTLPPYLVDTPETRIALTKYYAEITDFDRELGDCLAAVEMSGRPEDTIVVYTSEQGAQFPHGKWTCYDVGLRTACIVRWPRRVAGGSVSDALVQYVDLLPTLLDAAGGHPATIDTGRERPGTRGGEATGLRGFDGRSFLRVLVGEAKEHRQVVFGVHTTRGIKNGSECYPIRSIRTRTHKLIWNLNASSDFHNTLIAGTDRGVYWKSWLERATADAQARQLVESYQKRPEFELYALEEDPHELRNLSGAPEQAALSRRLRGELEAFLASQGDLGKATELRAFERQPRRRRREGSGPARGGKRP